MLRCAGRLRHLPRQIVQARIALGHGRLVGCAQVVKIALMLRARGGQLDVVLQVA